MLSLTLWKIPFYSFTVICKIDVLVSRSTRAYYRRFLFHAAPKTAKQDIFGFKRPHPLIITPSYSQNICKSTIFSQTIADSRLIGIQEELAVAQVLVANRSAFSQVFLMLPRDRTRQLLIPLWVA
jgi:hypothetical protein